MLALDACRPLTVSNEEFHLFQKLIHEEAGIYLAPVKRALLSARLSRRLRQLGLSTFGAYYRYVLEAGEDERRHLLDWICTNETRFFREEAQFEFLEHQIIPSWLADPSRSRSVRVWSAACSTGEEPFSLAMSLHAHLAAAGWAIRIVATDLSTRALARAEAAEWPVEQADQIPRHYLHRYMLRGRRSREGLMKAGPELRSLVEFSRLNLNDDSYPLQGQFDLVFCRNVLIYFDADGKRRVAERLIRHLLPGGYLFLGHAESGSGWRKDLVPVRPAVCRLESERR